MVSCILYFRTYEINLYFLNFFFFVLLNQRQLDCLDFDFIVGLADAPSALRHMNSDASEDDVFMAS